MTDLYRRMRLGRLMRSFTQATEDPSKTLLARKPYPRDRGVLSKVMMKNMLLHALWQLVILGTLIFGKSVRSVQCAKTSFLISSVIMDWDPLWEAIADDWSEYAPAFSIVLRQSFIFGVLIFVYLSTSALVSNFEDEASGKNLTMQSMPPHFAEAKRRLLGNLFQDLNIKPVFFFTISWQLTDSPLSRAVVGDTCKPGQNICDCKRGVLSSLEGSYGSKWVFWSDWRDTLLSLKGEALVRKASACIPCRWSAS